MQRPILSCCYHVKVAEVFEGRLYPLINLSAVIYTVDYISRAVLIFQIYMKAAYFIVEYQDKGTESYGLIEICMRGVFHSVVGQ